MVWWHILIIIVVWLSVIVVSAGVADNVSVKGRPLPAYYCVSAFSVAFIHLV